MKARLNTIYKIRTTHYIAIVQHGRVLFFALHDPVLIYLIGSTRVEDSFVTMYRGPMETSGSRFVGAVLQSTYDFVLQAPSGPSLEHTVYEKVKCT